ncbi:MAG: hypothetical protein ACO3DS_11035, partial [Phycisphaerales bacterium]
MLPFVLATMVHAQAPPVPAGQGAAGAAGGASAAPTPATPVVPTAASDREAASRRFQSNYLLGDWGGVRTELWEAGFEPTLLLITDTYGNPV